jgi:hypothetical protein
MPIHEINVPKGIPIAFIKGLLSISAPENTKYTVNKNILNIIKNTVFRGIFNMVYVQKKKLKYNIHIH